MKTFQLVSLFALVATAMAFVPNQAPKGKRFQKIHQLDQRFLTKYYYILSTVVNTVSNAFDINKAAIAAMPAAIAAPAFALDSIVEALPTNTLALEVQFGAYLAVTLGTLLPVLFLVNLYVQTESRKAGKAGGQDSE